MFQELLMRGMPHDEAGEDYKEFLKLTLELEVLKVVHYQLTTNTKVVLLRTRNENLDKFVGKKIQYRQWIITLEKHLRPIVKAINTIEKLSNEMQEKGEPRLKLQKLAKINLSNISNLTKMEDLQSEMKKFGKIFKIELFEKGQLKNKKRLKCRLAVIHYENIDGAIGAFFNDKVVINGVSSKIKLYLTPKKINSFLKKKKLMSNHSTQSGGIKDSSSGSQPQGKREGPRNQGRLAKNAGFNHFSNRNDHVFQNPSSQYMSYWRRGSPSQAYNAHLNPQYKNFQAMVTKRIHRDRDWNRTAPMGRKLKLRQDLEIDDITEIQNPHNLRFNRRKESSQANLCRGLGAYHDLPSFSLF